MIRVEGYSTPPAAQTVTVTYAGVNGSVTLAQPTSSYYDIGTLSRTQIDSTNKQATFTIRPNVGLTQGVYNNYIEIGTTPAQSKLVRITPSFTVTKPTITSVAITPKNPIVKKGDTQAFTATVEGTNFPAQTVAWKLTGNNSSDTTIKDGLLTIAKDETATVLSVTANSTVDPSNVDSVLVTVIAAEPDASTTPVATTTPSTTTPVASATPGTAATPCITSLPTAFAVATATSKSDISPKNYKIAKGNESSWSHKTDGNKGLTFESPADFSKFTGVFVDNTKISSSKYIAKRGSTIVTLKASYLKTLSSGKHTLRMNFTDGFSKTSFWISDDKSKKSSHNRTPAGTASNTFLNGSSATSSSPTTNDNSEPMLWAFLMIIAFIGLIAIKLYKTGKEVNN